MYETPIAYEQVKERYPDALTEIEQQIKASKAKYRGKPIADTPISLFRFEFYCSVSGTMSNNLKASYTGKEFMEKVKSGELQKELQKSADEKKLRDATMTRDEKMVERLSRLHGMTVRAKLTGSNRTFGAKIDEIPEEVRKLVLERVEYDIAEGIRRANRTPEQQEQETQVILKELSKSSGFVGFRIGVANPGMQGSGGVGATSSEVYIESGYKPAESVKLKRLDLDDLLNE